MTLLLDLDDVLAILRKSLYQTLTAVTGINTHWRQWPHYDLTRHYNISKAELNSVLMREQVLENCAPEPEAAATTHALRELGYRQIIITARGWHPDAYAITSDWLTQHGIYHDELLAILIAAYQP